jgi:threonine dehydratase
MTMPPTAITPDDILAAAERIRGDVRPTPLWRLPGAALGLDVAEVGLKLEQLQLGGSFKARGMFNRMRALPLPAAGVVVASGGNAGIAVATAARALGVECEVFLPEVSSAAKRAALAALGARVVVHGAAYADALAACLSRQRESGALLMHAYDQPEVVAGAGTLAREIEAEAGLPDRVLVSVGGGGLIGGVAAWFAGRTRVEALEPTLAPTLHAAREAGTPVDVAVSGLAADSLGARRIGDIAWAVNRQGFIATSHLLSDDAIRAAQQRLWREFRLAVEPAAALGLAALWAGVVKPAAHERVAVILCGANLDPAGLA